MNTGRKLLVKIRDLFRTAGFDVRRWQGTEMGVDMWADIKLILGHSKNHIIFDVGANTGQTIEKLVELVNDPLIYAFEPGPKAYANLRRNTSELTDVRIYEIGLSSKKGVLKFFDNTQSDVSSFHKPTERMWGSVNEVLEIEVTTIDDFCTQHNIERIDFIKIDTQGHDLEVIRGASRMLAEKRVGLVQIEVTYESLYEDQPRMDEILKFMLDIDFKIVAFYGFHHENFRARWSDILFVNETYMQPGKL